MCIIHSRARAQHYSNSLKRSLKWKLKWRRVMEWTKKYPAKNSLSFKATLFA